MPLAFATIIVRTLLILASFTVSAGQSAFQTPDSIAAAARDFLTASGIAVADAQVDVGAMDPRTRLPACRAPLVVQNASMVGNSNRQLLNMRCAEGPAPWSIYVPVTIHTQQAIAVLAQPVALNATLTPADIRMELRDSAQLSGTYFTTPEAVIGKTLIFQIGVGLPIPQNALHEPITIRRGQTVTLISTGPGIQVAMHGLALSDAANGQVLRVKNLNSKRIVQGIATAPGTVTVD